MGPRFDLSLPADLGNNKWLHKKILRALGQQFYFVSNFTMGSGSGYDLAPFTRVGEDVSLFFSFDKEKSDFSFEGVGDGLQGRDGWHGEAIFDP